MLRIVRRLLHPIPKLRLMHTQIFCGLRVRHAPLLDQPHSLKLELAGKLPSLHDPPPAPSKHLTRCLRNPVQAKVVIETLKKIHGVHELPSGEKAYWDLGIENADIKHNAY